MADILFTTGPATLPDVGTLSYNGCIFSPLFETTVSGNAVKDRANRTVKFVEYTIIADGYVTLPANRTSVNSVMDDLRTMLQAQAGALKYTGRGLDLSINAQGGGGVRDVAWGPVPEILEFQPLGSGRSAKIRWQVKVAITEQNITQLVSGGKNKVSIKPLQFNFETSVTYAEDCYSTLSVKGTIEIPLTRVRQGDRLIPITVDALRADVARRIMLGIDLSRFRVTNREFAISRDKRTLEWNFTAEERPYMDMPPDCSIARGNYNVRPTTAGMGLASWLCTLRATYTVRPDRPRRTAWVAFLILLRLRMLQSALGNVPSVDDVKEKEKPSLLRRGFNFITNPIGSITEEVFGINLSPVALAKEGFNKLKNLFGADKVSLFDVINNILKPKAFLLDFTIDEGLYLDSKTVSFSATWKIITTFSHILLASGLWKKVPETNAAGQNLWALSMRDVQGAQSWLPNALDPGLDVIVDFGGGVL